eukprot:m.356081 g.356081  ORF g.356081 m.356081 type:complete len:92 (+) comp17432_c0_seq1:11-286(+)
MGWFILHVNGVVHFEIQSHSHVVAHLSNQSHAQASACLLATCTQQQTVKFAGLRWNTFPWLSQIADSLMSCALLVETNEHSTHLQVHSCVG